MPFEKVAICVYVRVCVYIYSFIERDDSISMINGLVCKIVELRRENGSMFVRDNSYVFTVRWKFTVKKLCLLQTVERDPVNGNLFDTYQIFICFNERTSWCLAKYVTNYAVSNIYAIDITFQNYYQNATDLILWFVLNTKIFKMDASRCGNDTYIKEWDCNKI